jgi:PAS domain S-box-containing protein
MAREHELNFRDLVDAAPDGVVVCDQSGHIMLVNRQAETMFGYTRAELVGKRIEELIPERLRVRHPEHLRAYVDSPKSRPMGSGLDLFGRRRDGTEFPVEISLSPIRTGDAMVVSAAIRDVSDRKRIEAEARRANAYLISAVDSIQDAFALYDEEDRVVLVNSTFRERIGVTSKGPIVGRRFVDLVDDILAAGLLDTSAESADQLRERWLAYHRAPSGTLELRTANRTLRVVDQPTAEHGTVSLIVDVTEDRMRADELRRARELAEAASAAKSEFLASMSHELRTPLNAILGYTELILDNIYGDTPDRMRATLDRVQRNGRHLLGLINDVLDLSKIEAGQLSLSISDYSLRQIVQDVFGAVESLAKEKHIGFKAEMPPGLPQGRGDERRLTQVLLNLVGNAIKFTDQGEVVIEASEAGGTFKVAVRDTGPGISAIDQGRIFEEFQQADNSITKTKGGTGLGLAIARRIMELHGGQLWVESEVGAGSTFIFTLPVQVEQQARQT